MVMKKECPKCKRRIQYQAISSEMIGQEIYFCDYCKELYKFKKCQ